MRHRIAIWTFSLALLAAEGAAAAPATAPQPAPLFADRAPADGFLNIDSNDVTVALVLGQTPKVLTAPFRSSPSYHSGDVAYWREAGRRDGQDGSGAWMAAVSNPNVYYEEGLTNPLTPTSLVRVQGKLYYRWSEYLPTPEKRRESEAYWKGLVEARQGKIPHVRIQFMPLAKGDVCTMYGCIAEVRYE